MKRKIKSFLDETLPLKGIKNLVLFLIIAVVFQFLLFATPILAKEAVEKDKNINRETPIMTEVVAKKNKSKNKTIARLPKNPDKPFKVVKTIKSHVTAYNAGDPFQTDSTPCLSANGENICQALEKGHKRCAANFVPLGTTIEVEGYGKCLVTDRMNARYTHRVDIAMKKNKKAKAREFGVRWLEIKILKKDI